MLDEYSDADLEREIERRKQLKKSRIPTMLPEKEVKQRLWDKLAAGVYEEVSSVINGEYSEDNDNSYFVWEAVMEAFYGDNFFDWWNKAI